MKRLEKLLRCQAVRALCIAIALILALLDGAGLSAFADGEPAPPEEPPQVVEPAPQPEPEPEPVIVESAGPSDSTESEPETEPEALQNDPEAQTEGEPAPAEEPDAPEPDPPEPVPAEEPEEQPAPAPAPEPFAPYYVLIGEDCAATEIDTEKQYALTEGVVALCVEEGEDSSKIAFLFGEKIITANIRNAALKKLDREQDAPRWQPQDGEEFALYRDDPDYPLRQADKSPAPEELPTDEPPVVEVPELPASLTLGVKESFALPAGSGEVTFATSNKKIATVSAVGVVKGVKEGGATITATAGDGTKVTCKVTVRKAPTSVTLSATKLTLGEGQEGTLKAKLPSKTASRITWTTSNNAVAEVENGVVQALSAGTATITAKTFNGKKATCKVIVRPAPMAVTLPETMKVCVGQTTTLKGVLEPDTALGTITYACEDAEILSVSGDKLTGTAAGVAAVTATTHNGHMATCLVTVVDGPTAVTLDRTSASIGIKEKLTLAAAIDADEELLQYNVWKSSNTKVATVTAAGVVKGVKEGSATITVTAANGKKTTCKVTVKKAPTKVTLSSTSVTLGEGQERKLKAMLPARTASQIAWTSSNSAVAEVENGTVRAISAGTATITAKTFNGKKATCKVTVRPAPTGVTLPETMKICLGQTTTLKGVLLPDKALGTITYASADEGIVTVRGNKITGTATGVAVVTATTHNGCTADCLVSVVEGPTTVALGKKTVSIGVREKLKLAVSIDADEELLQYNSWKSSNTKVATVTAGVVKGLKEGSATITVTTVNGKKASCKVTVKKAPTKVMMSPTMLSVGEGQTGKLRVLMSSKTASQITWTSSNSDVAVVENGVVTGISEGRATITAKTFNGKKVTCAILVRDPASMNTVDGIRARVVSRAVSFLGCREGNGSHKKIIDLYNSHRPLAINYAVQYTDSWCDAFVSAVMIAEGLTDIVPTECGCNRHIRLLRQKKCWVEDDAYVPSPGDIIFYDWSDTGKGNDINGSDHVGIVVSVSDGVITVIEGNKEGAVGYRKVAVDGRYIRGFAAPHYEKRSESN